MGRRFLIRCLAALMVTSIWVTASYGAQGGMVTDFSQQSIEVDVRFHGEKIYFFGTVPDPEAAVVVKLVPEHSPPIKLIRKGRVVLFWMGTKQFELKNLPFLYKLHSSKPLKEVLTPELASKLRLGYQTLKDDMELHQLSGGEDPDDRDVMFQGFVDLKEKANLYRVEENRIRIRKGRLFEHYFTFPDKAKEGDYRVVSYAIKDGKVLAESSDKITIKKVGITAWLYRTSQENGLLYGTIAVLVALGAGLLVGVFFKGGGH